MASLVKKILQLESSSGLLLLTAALFALMWSNSPFSASYQVIFSTPLEISLGKFYVAKPLLFWINEGLMSIFFLFIGLELRRGMAAGELKQAFLPAFAALGGMIVPGIIYLLININDSVGAKGWAIPVATDIAFALGALSLFGKRVPTPIKLFLMTLAIFDDIGAILIIAIFYTHDLSFIWLSGVGLIIFILWALALLRVSSITLFLLLGIALWFCFLKSGVHATIAGVVLAFFIPAKKAMVVEKVLHPWASFVITPLFALANAGVSIAGLGLGIILNTVSLGIILGLFIGKLVGVYFFTWIAVALRWARFPKNVTYRELLGVSLLCGIGFTMSLFLGNLAFEYESAFYLIKVKVGVLLGSTLSGVIGIVILHTMLKKKGKEIEAS